MVDDYVNKKNGRITENASSVADRLEHSQRSSKFFGALHVGETASGQTIDIPYMIAKGVTDGPTLWINGAVHGDELNGVLGAIDFFTNLNPKHLTGNLIITPVSNVLALDARNKVSFLDYLDLDQQFPGNAQALLSSRIAAKVFNEMAELADVVVNLHTHGTQYASLPYGVYKHHDRCPLSAEGLLALIATFNPALVCRMPVQNAPGELPGNIAGALDYQCSNLGKAAFMMEMGGGGREEPEYVRATIAGFKRLTAKLGMLPIQEHPAGGNKTKMNSVRQVTSRMHVLADRGGFFRSDAVPGAYISAGERIGAIHNVYGELVQDVRLDHDCVVIGIRSNPVIHTGDRICFIGKTWVDTDIDDESVNTFLSELTGT